MPLTDMTLVLSAWAEILALDCLRSAVAKVLW